jgi:hypothetical protein
MEEITGDWRKLQTGELKSLHSSLDIINGDQIK